MPRFFRFSRASPAALVAALVALAAGLTAATREELTALRRLGEQLRQERELSRGRDFYLRLDARTRRLALMLEGVVLDDYPVLALERGVPRVLFVDRRPPAGWDLVAFRGGRLDPARGRDRIEVEAPVVAEGVTPSPPPVPPTAEDTYSVPSRYRITFDGGVSLEVGSNGGGGRNRSLVRRVADAMALGWADWRGALGIGHGDRIRLRLTLQPADAAALYRSLPPDVHLLVVGLP